MGRQVFTQPVQTEMERAAGAGDIMSTDVEWTDATATKESPQVIYTNNSGSPEVVETAFISFRGSPTEDILFELAMFQSDGTVIAGTQGHYTQFPIDFSPGVKIKDGETVEVQTSNYSGADHDVMAGITYRNVEL